MSFQTKDALSILASMLNRARATTQKITDYTVGAIARTILEAVAQEIEELYQQMLAGLLQAIPVATYNTFSFAALPAIAASNLVTVTITAQTGPVLIPAGSTFTRTDTNGTYASVADVTIATGQTTANVQVAASVAGSAGNAPANTPFTVAPSPAGFVSATNTTAFTNGADAESDAARKSRFDFYVSNLSRGPVSSLLYGASISFLTDANGNITEKVAFASVVEPYLTNNAVPPAIVDVYVHNGVGNTSAALVAQCQTVENGYYDATGKPVPGYKAAGTNLTVSAATEVAIPLTATITLAPGALGTTVAPLVSSAIYGYIKGLPLGGTCYLAKLYSLAMAVPGVQDFVITAPTADITSTASQKLMPGISSITVPI